MRHEAELMFDCIRDKYGKPRVNQHICQVNNGLVVHCGCCLHMYSRHREVSHKKY